MSQSRPLTGSSPAPARPAEAPAGAPRSGQVPSRERPAARACFLAVRAVRREGELDRAATVAKARGLAALGFGVALGLDVRERAELGWPTLLALVQEFGAGAVVGVSSEPVGSAAGIGEQLEAIAQQTAAVEEAGGVPLVLPLPSLSRRRVRAAEYVEVYRTLLARLTGPVLLDWTGPLFRPELLDYFPETSFERVMALDPAKVRGVRLALLDVKREARLRRELLTREQLLFTADRAHLGPLLLGTNPGVIPAQVPAAQRFIELAGREVALGDFSHGMLDGLEDRAELLAAALELLAAGEVTRYLEAIAPLE